MIVYIYNSLLHGSRMSPSTVHGLIVCYYTQACSASLYGSKASTWSNGTLHVHMLPVRTLLVKCSLYHDCIYNSILSWIVKNFELYIILILACYTLQVALYMITMDRCSPLRWLYENHWQELCLFCGANAGLHHVMSCRPHGIYMTHAHKKPFA